MNSISLKTKVGADGKLTLQLPAQFTNKELDLVVVYQAAEPSNDEQLHKTVDEFYGCLEDDPILIEEHSTTEIA